MLLVSYDISDNKLRTKFAKFLSRFGYRLQYSLFEINNSERVVENIRAEIKNNFGKQFDQTDSMMIIKLNPTCKIECYGYARNDEDDVLMIG